MKRGRLKGRLKVRRFRLELLGESECDLESLELTDAIRRWQPHVVTIEEGDAALKAAGERQIMVAEMPKGRAAKFRAPVGLTVPAGEKDLEPSEAVATLLQALLLNPKTNLLGTWALEEEVERRIRAREPFGYLYLDIDHFKSYNDKYGVSEGDKVIRLLAEEVERATDRHGNDEDICAHIGGDDFAIVTTPEKMEAIGRPLASDFAARVLAFYSEGHRKQGFIEIEDRQRHVQQFPLMTISVAAVNTAVTEIRSYQGLCDIAAQLKAHLKSLGGNRYAEERRRGKAPAAKRAAS